MSKPTVVGEQFKSSVSEVGISVAQREFDRRLAIDVQLDLIVLKRAVSYIVR